MYFTAKNP